jgi:hypothetical protein
VRIIAWIVTGAITFPALYLVVELARAWGFDLMLAIFGTLIAVIVVDDFVARRSLIKR